MAMRLLAPGNGTGRARAVRRDPRVAGALELAHSQRRPVATAEQTRALVMLEGPATIKLVQWALRQHDCVTREAADTGEAVRALTEWRPHVAIIDMDARGTELLRRLGGGRDAGTQIPVVGLTRHGDLRATLAAFQQGVDDVMTIPFSPDELGARVRVITRRASRQKQSLPDHPTLKLGDLELDILCHAIRLGSAKLSLSKIEQSLLYLLAAKAGQVVSRDEILDTLWGANCFPQSNILDRHVCNLRAKLQRYAQNPWHIVTVARRGYCLADITERENAEPDYCTKAG